MITKVTFCILLTDNVYLPKEYVFTGLTPDLAYHRAIDKLAQEKVNAQVIDYRVETIKNNKNCVETLYK